MTRTEFNALDAAATSEMARLYPRWNPNTYTYLRTHANIMRQMASGTYRN